VIASILRRGLLAGLASLLLPLASANAAPVKDSIVATHDSGGLRLVDPSTKRVTKLPAFHGPAESVGVQRSADGRFLYDAETTTSGSFVYRYTLSSGRTENMGPFPVQGKLVWAFGVSPDNKRVVIATSTYGLIDTLGLGQVISDGPVRVDVLNLASRSATPLVAPIPSVKRGIYGDHNPDRFTAIKWAPNGGTVAITHQHKWLVTGAPASDKPYTRLEAYAPNGGSPRVLVDQLDENTPFAWAPNSRRLAVAAEKRLQLVDVASGRRSTVVRKPIWRAVFSHSGRRLAYVRNVGLNKIELHIRNLATKRDVRVKLNASLISWARRGERLAVCLPSRGLVIVDVRGKIKPLGKKICEPIWGAGGTP
jgi:hypothetical protein